MELLSHDRIIKCFDCHIHALSSSQPWYYHLNQDIGPSECSFINSINHSLIQRGSSLHFSKFGFWKNTYHFHIMVARLDGQNSIASKLTPQEKVVSLVGCTSVELFVAEKSESCCMGCWAIIITCIRIWI